MTDAYGSPSEHRITANGVSLCYFQWGEPAGVDLLLVHATGFHGRCWDQVVANLAPGYRVIAPDMRGHGRSERQGPYNWSNFGGDLTALVDALELDDLVGVGHSMGGHTLLQLAIARPRLLRRMLLLDPVVFEPDAYPSDRYRGFETPEQHPVSRRRNHWLTWQAMQTSLASKGSFGLWDPAVMEDYCRYGSLPVADGVELACPPLVEAAVYIGNTSTNVHVSLDQVQTPTWVLRAPPRSPGSSPEMDFAMSPTWPQLAANLPQGHDVLLSDLTHFIPMQRPDLVADYIGSADS